MGNKELRERFEAIEMAVAEARVAACHDNPANCIDWLTTVQLKTAEMAASFMTEIRNNPRPGPVVRVKSVVRVDFLLNDGCIITPDSAADEDGWRVCEFDSEDAAYIWAEENVSCIAEATFSLCGFSFVSRGRIER